MLRLKSCPKCKGEVIFDRDKHGWYEYCLQCGHSHDMESLVEAHEPHREREKPQSRSTSRQKIKVSTFSHQPLLQEGILHSLSRTEDIQVISQDKASDKESVIRIMPADVLIVDIDGLSDSGQSLVCRLKQHIPSVGIIVLTSSSSDDQLLWALEAEVAAYLTKEINSDYLADIVRRVANSEDPINENLGSHPGVAQGILRQFQELYVKTEVESPISPLTVRETEVLNYIAQGYSNKEIAYKLDTSDHTIKNQVSSILTKLNANVRTQAVVIAAQQGLISIA